MEGDELAALLVRIFFPLFYLANFNLMEYFFYWLPIPVRKDPWFPSFSLLGFSLGNLFSFFSRHCKLVIRFFFLFSFLLLLLLSFVFCLLSFLPFLLVTMGTNGDIVNKAGGYALVLMWWRMGVQVEGWAGGRFFLRGMVVLQTQTEKDLKVRLVLGICGHRIVPSASLLDCFVEMWRCGLASGDHNEKPCWFADHLRSTTAHFWIRWGTTVPAAIVGTFWGVTLTHHHISNFNLHVFFNPIPPHLQYENPDCGDSA